MSQEYTPQQIVEIKANAKASKLVLAHKQNPKHFHLLKSVVSKIENMSGAKINVPSEYKIKED